MYRVGQKSDTARTLHYIVREVSLLWPTPYTIVHKYLKIPIKPLFSNTIRSKNMRFTFLAHVYKHLTVCLLILRSFCAWTGDWQSEKTG